MRSRACLEASEVPFGPQELLPSWCRTLGSQNEHKAGQLEAWKIAILGQKSARIGCRLGLAGHEVRSRACLDASEVPFGLQELLPSWCWTFGSQNEHIAGQLEAWKIAILGQKSARIRCRLGFAGYKVRSKAHVDISWGSVAKKTLFCRAWRASGKCRTPSS